MLGSANIEDHLRPQQSALSDEVRGGDGEGGQLEVLEDVRRVAVGVVLTRLCDVLH